jgi:hypothetical protein
VLAAVQGRDLGGQIGFGGDRDLLGQYRDDRDAGGEGLGEFPADPVVWVVDPTTSGCVGGGQPAGPDHGQQHRC